MWPEHELHDIARLQHEEQLRRAADRRLAVAVRRGRRVEPAADATASGAGRHRPWTTAMSWLRQLTSTASSARSTDPRKA